MQVTTRPGPTYPAPPNPTDIPVDMAPWDRVTTQGERERRVNFDLREPSGSVTVWAFGLPQDSVEAVARSLTRRPAGAAGWDVALPPQFSPGSTYLYEGSMGSESLHQLQWSNDQSPVAELIVANGIPNLFLSGAGHEPDISLLDVGGTPAVAERVALEGQGDRVVVTWSPTPGELVQLRMIGSLDDARRFLDGLREVDLATWTNASVTDPSTSDGCGPSVMGC